MCKKYSEEIINEELLNEINGRQKTVRFIFVINRTKNLQLNLIVLLLHQLLILLKKNGVQLLILQEKNGVQLPILLIFLS